MFSLDIFLYRSLPRNGTEHANCAVMARRICGAALVALSLSAVGCALDSEVLDSDALDSEVLDADGDASDDHDEVASNEAALTPSPTSWRT